MGKLKYLVGETNDFTLEMRLFHSICIILSFAGIFGMVINIIIELPALAIFLSASIIFMPVFFLYLSRWKRKERLAKALFLIWAYMVSVFLWFYNGGIDGIVYFLLIILLLLQVFFSSKYNKFWLVVNILVFISLLFVNYRFPQIIIGTYEKDFYRYLDHGFTYTIGAFSVFFIFKVLINGYLNEKNKADEKNLELAVLNEELNKSVKQLKNVNSTKDQLFSVVSHDMRSFSGAIQNYSYLLNEHKNDITPENDELYKQQIYKSSKDLNDLMNNLLSWASLQMNSIEPSPVSCNLKAMVIMNYDLYRQSIIHKNIEFNQNIDENSEVFADGEMLKCIIRNVLSNAIKFTPLNGKILVETKKSQHPGFVDLLIRDTGQGMGNNILTLIQQKDVFYSQRGTNNEAGSGMGFIIIKEYIEANKGFLQIDSKKGKGTVVTVSLPLVQ